MSSRKIGLYMILVGIAILSLKLSFNTGVKIYPEYKTDYKIASEFQAYTLNYFYGANDVVVDESDTSLDVYYTGFRIDILSNIIGYILVIIGTMKLKDVSKVFSLSRMLAYVGLVLTIVIKLLPFIFNGYQLCYIALFVGIAELFAALSVSYLFVYAICTILDDIVFKTDRVYIGMCYLGIAITTLVVAFVTWVSVVSKVLLGVYTILCVGTVVLLIYNVYKVQDYIVKERGLE